MATKNDTVREGDDEIEICVGICEWFTADGKSFLEEDFKVDGKIWRIHKGDADPLPSNPHAHCVGGGRRFVGCKLHLGTRELFSSTNKPLSRYLGEDQFERILNGARKKFPDIDFPLPVSAN